MAKVYFICCQDAGVECDFAARGDTIDEVIERCADHSREQHNMHTFTPDLYVRMRRIIQVIEEEAPQ